MGIEDFSFQVAEMLERDGSSTFHKAPWAMVLAGESSNKRDERLIALLTEARSLGREVSDNPDRTIADLAKQASRCRKRMAQLIRLNWLAPDIVQAIVDGTQPARLTATTLLDVVLPIAWTEQRTLLGFAA